MRTQNRPKVKRPPKKTQEVFEYLKKKANEQRKAYYGEIAGEVGLANQGVNYPLFFIYEHCRKLGLPELNAIAVNKKTGRPGSGYPGSCNTWEDDIDKVLSYKNWDSISFDDLLYKQTLP